MREDVLSGASSRFSSGSRWTAAGDGTPPLASATTVAIEHVPSHHGSPRSTEDEITKLGRNDPCHCGSKKKYKKCHLAEDEAARTAELAEKNAALAEAAREAAQSDPEAAALKEEAAKAGLTKAAGARADKRPQTTPTTRQVRRRGVA